MDRDLGIDSVFRDFAALEANYGEPFLPRRARIAAGGLAPVGAA